jgi:hypothetical protein
MRRGADATRSQRSYCLVACLTERGTQTPLIQPLACQKRPTVQHGAATRLASVLQRQLHQPCCRALPTPLVLFLANFLHRAPTSLLTCTCANHHPDSATKPTPCVETVRRVNESALVTTQFSNSNPVPPKYNLPPTQRPHPTRQAHRRRPRRPPTIARVRYPRVTRLPRLLGTRLPHLLRAESISRPTSTP